MLSTAATIQVKVPLVGSPEEDARTVELKLRQVQKNKGTMKVESPADPACLYNSQAMQHKFWKPANSSLLGDQGQLKALQLRISCKSCGRAL